MKTEELINYIQNSSKKTPVLALVNSDQPLKGSFNQILFAQKEEVLKVLKKNEDRIRNVQLYCPARNSALDLMKINDLNARIEYGAIIREQVEIGDNAVIMMGAVLNVGCQIGKKTMIDMGAVIGARAIIKDNCHIGANAVIAGVLEPPSAKEVIIENNVLVGAGAVILEGVHIYEGAVIAAGAVVTDDVFENCVAAGCPAKIIKKKDKKTEGKTQLIDALRSL